MLIPYWEAVAEKGIRGYFVVARKRIAASLESYRLTGYEPWQRPPFASMALFDR